MVRYICLSIVMHARINGMMTHQPLKQIEPTDVDYGALELEDDHTTILKGHKDMVRINDFLFWVNLLDDT
jgi:hypothetical protein